jgi:hypothetical protein
MNYGTLPVTGAGVLIAGNYYDAWWIAAVGIGVVLIGAALVRLGFRSNKTHAEV